LYLKNGIPSWRFFPCGLEIYTRFAGLHLADVAIPLTEISSKPKDELVL
jgi:uncharacterized protein YwlG (UPF0340 family)